MLLKYLERMNQPKKFYITLNHFNDYRLYNVKYRYLLLTTTSVNLMKNKCEKYICGNRYHLTEQCVKWHSKLRCHKRGNCSPAILHLHKAFCNRFAHRPVRISCLITFLYRIQIEPLVKLHSGESKALMRHF